MFELIKRLALSFTLLLYVTVEPRAHAPEIFMGTEEAQQPPAAPPVVNKPLNGISSFSLLREPDFKAPLNRGAKKEAGEVRQPAPTQKNRMDAKRDGKERAAASYGARADRPANRLREKIPATFNPQVLLLPDMQRWMTMLSARYNERTGQRLHVTSAYRTPERQARAIDRNLRTFGRAYVLTIYRRSQAIREIVSAHNRNRRRKGQAVMAMTRVIEAQIRRGVYISRHMLGRAFDIRSKGPNGAKLSVLQEVAQSMGGRVLVEKNHYHVEF